MLGMGCRVIAYDPCPSDDLAEQGVVYKALDELWASADIVSLHCPLTPVNYHMIDQTVLEQMKQGVMLINTSRDRKSTRLNSSHVATSYAVFCLKKKKEHTTRLQ